jgi:hypothetical protein
METPKFQITDTSHVEGDLMIKSPSLRSFPMDAISALPPLHSPRINTAFGGNPQSQLRARSDVGSIGQITQLIEPMEEVGHMHSVQNITLSVCKHCQDSLLGAFEHCLSKNGETMAFQSIHDIDEDADAQLQTEPPVFDIIKDPTASKNTPLLDHPQSQIERDRWVLHQSKSAAAKLDITAKKAKGLGVKTGRHFSGAIYKRMLDAKEKEITELRKRLYDSMRREENESDSVRKLKKALNKSVHYYTFAEEWQKSESSRLQADVKHLKNEISSLMAFLINSEVEKQNVRPPNVVDQ